MLHRRLYVRITALVIGSLLAFSCLAYITWGIHGLDQYEQEFHNVTAGLIEFDRKNCPALRCIVYGI